jgi:hypothetical protein
VAFTAAVSAAAPGAGVPTGTVSFLDNGVLLGKASLALVNGLDVATLTAPAAGVTSLGLGTDAVTAVYNSDIDFGTSTSSTLIEAVNPDGTSTTLTANAANNTSLLGQAVTFTATVKASAPGTSTPTGTVQFQIDGSNYGNPVTLSGGSAYVSAANLALGSHTVTAQYNPTPTFTGGAPATLVQTINAATSSSLTSSANPSTFGQPVTFTAIVTNTSGGGGTPAGVVQFYDNGTLLGAGTALAGGGTKATATLTSAALAGGSHAIQAVYLPSGFFAASTAYLGQAVVAATSTSVASSFNPSTYNQFCTFTATVTNTSGGSTPTGSVAFYKRCKWTCAKVSRAASI